MSKSLITFVKVDFGYDILYENCVSLGKLESLDDGFYNWWHEPGNGGYWDSSILRAIADKIDELNAPLEKEINEYFEKLATTKAKTGLEGWQSVIREGLDED